MNGSPARLFASEAIGTGLLLATVVGSGIMAERLAGGNVAIALLANTFATACILVVLILMLGPVSGAHMNPAVTLMFALRGELSARRIGLYVVAQLVGAVFGVILAHAMFGEALVQASTHARAGPSQWLSEFTATFGLIGVILGVRRARADAVPLAVGLYIAAAYWFTASTSFANPAVALARSLTDTFSGIARADVPAFVVAELVGAVTAMISFGWMLKPTGGGEHALQGQPDRLSDRSSP
jgi:glycerol uptake facilitator-like aquaporin